MATSLKSFLLAALAHLSLRSEVGHPTTISQPFSVFSAALC